MKLLLLLILLVSALCSCSTLDRDPKFGSPEIYLGQTISVRGYLVFEAENMNLYPSENWRQNFADLKCLPVGVRFDDDVTAKKAENLSRSWVTLTGVIIDSFSEEEVSIAYCRDFVLLVSNIE